MFLSVDNGVRYSNDVIPWEAWGSILRSLDLVSLIAVSSVSEYFNLASRQIWEDCTRSKFLVKLDWHWLSRGHSEIHQRVPKHSVFSKQKEECNLMGLIEMRWSRRTLWAQVLCEKSFSIEFTRTYSDCHSRRTRQNSTKSLWLNSDFTFLFHQKDCINYNYYNPTGIDSYYLVSRQGEWRETNYAEKTYETAGKWAFVYPSSLPLWKDPKKAHVKLGGMKLRKQRIERDKDDVAIVLLPSTIIKYPKEYYLRLQYHLILAKKSCPAMVTTFPYGVNWYGVDHPSCGPLYSPDHDIWAGLES